MHCRAPKPNPSVEGTAHRLRRWVPSALRAPVAAELTLYATGRFVTMLNAIAGKQLIALLMLACAEFLILPSPSFAGELAVIEYTGSGIGFCGLRKDPICQARVLLVDGNKSDFLSSEVRVEPGKHTLRMSCSVKFGAFSSMKFFSVDRAVTIRPNGKYHVQGAMEGDICLTSLIDESTNEVAAADVLEIKASPPGTYPTSEPISLFSSSDTVSSWTETPAEDHLIPNSQIYVSGGEGKAGNAGGLFGGATGAVIGVQIDRASNAAKISRIENELRITFSKTLSEALRTQIAARSKPASYEVVDESNKAQLVLLPSARLVVSEDGTAALAFRLTVRIYDRQNGKESKKNFFYATKEKLTLEGAGSWSENHSKAILDTASIALTKLSTALLDDIDGISTTVDPNSTKSDVVLREH